MIFPFGPLLDPCLQSRDLLRREWLYFSWGRHPFVVVVGRDPLPYQRVLQVSLGNHVLAVAVGEGFVLEIEAELSFACRLVGPVASEAMLSQDRADLCEKANSVILGTAVPAVLSFAKARFKHAGTTAKAGAASIDAPTPQSHGRWMYNRIAKPHSARIFCPRCERPHDCGNQVYHRSR